MLQSLSYQDYAISTPRHEKEVMDDKKTVVQERIDGKTMREHKRDGYHSLDIYMANLYIAL